MLDRFVRESRTDRDAVFVLLGAGLGVIFVAELVTFILFFADLGRRAVTERAQLTTHLGAIRCLPSFASMIELAPLSFAVVIVAGRLTASRSKEDAQQETDKNEVRSIHGRH